MIHKLRVIPLGGVEQVGKNCMVFEYGSDIIIVDLGVGFPGPDLPGVDWLLPNISYLEKKLDQIRGIIITHGHLDHIGGIPFLIHRLGNPPIFATRLTIGLIEGRTNELGLRNLKFNTIEADKVFTLGSFKIDPFHVVHNIPDSVGLSITTPIGTVIHTGDFKFDDNPGDQRPVDKKKLKRIGEEGVLALFSDSTNAEVSGHTLSEKEIGEKIEEIVRQAPARIIFTSFSTLISRIHQAIIACQKYNRKMAIVGFSIKKSIAIAQELGYIKIPPGLLIDIKDINQYPDNKLFILVTGTQGEERSVMTRISRGQYYMVKIKKSDSVIFSSSAIPGNELAIHRTMNGLIDQGAKIIYQPILGAGVHSSGHAQREELKEMLNLIKPKFFIPIEGEHYMQAQHIELAKESGIKRENCFMLKNGNVLEIDEYQGARILPQKINGLSLIVQGRMVKVLEHDIIVTRRKMADVGVCIISISFDRKRGQENIQVVFLGLSVGDKIISEIKNKVRNFIKKYGTKKRVKLTIESRLGDFILNKIGKKPVVAVV